MMYSNQKLTFVGDSGMPGTDGGGGTSNRGLPDKLISDRQVSNCVLVDDGTTTTKE